MPGAKNRSTLAKEAVERAAVVAVTANLSPEAFATLTPLEVLLAVMAAKMASGDLMAAANIAEKAAPYVHARKSANPTDTVIPAELMPDHAGDAAPDEPSPANPIL